MGLVQTRYGPVWYMPQGNPNDSPLVLLHGNSMTAASQERLAHLFTDEHQVFSIDLLGHGHSARPENLFTTRYFAMQGEALVDLLARLFPDQAVPVFGMSAGAIAIMHAVCEDDTHIAAMILDSMFRSVTAETVAAHRAHVRAIGPVWERFLQKQHGEDWWQELQRGLLQVIEELAATGASVTPCLEYLTIPTLVLHGGKDPFCPPEEGQAIVASIPGARLIYDSGAGHILAWTYPVAFREIVRGFLRDRRSEERL